MSGYYKWEVKVIDKEINVNGENYTKILHKDFFYYKKEAKECFEIMRKKYPGRKIKLLHNIKGKWYTNEEI